MGYWNLVHSEWKPRKLWLVQGVSQVFESSSIAGRPALEARRHGGEVLEERNHTFCRFSNFLEYPLRLRLAPLPWDSAD
jgi:hypothetical protein